MTRVNLIPAKMLLDQHLRAELREIPRIITQSRIIEFPDSYRLGTGHVSFFYNKLNFIIKRIIELDNECKYRNFSGISLSYINSLQEQAAIKLSLNNNYLPTKEAVKLSLERILERVSSKPYWYKMNSINLNHISYEKYKYDLSNLS